MGNARRTEAAIAPACRAAALPGLDQHDAFVRVALACQQGCPQPGEPAADDGEIATHFANLSCEGGRRTFGIQPIGLGNGVFEAGECVLGHIGSFLFLGWLWTR
ncbi:hypothetical protein D3C78_1308110 [compost metagenome]